MARQNGQLLRFIWEHGKYNFELQICRITGSEENWYTPTNFNPAALLENDERYLTRSPISKDLEVISITELRQTSEGSKRALSIIKEIFYTKQYIHKDVIFLSLAKLVHGKSGVIIEYNKTDNSMVL